MKTLDNNIANSYLEGMQAFLSSKNEECLERAYELGRRSLKEGFSELDIVEMHHTALVNIEEAKERPIGPEQMKRISAYLKEWLAPFEVKLRSYRELIEEVQEKNKLLNQEIENRKEMEAELQSSKEYFKSLIENGQDIITVLDHSSIIRYSSPSVERILGYRQTELNGRDAFQYVHDEDLERVRTLFERVTSTPGQTISVEFRFRSKEGEWIYLESVAKNVEGSRDGPIVVVNSRNITERKKAMQRLEEHKIQLADAQIIARVGSWQWMPEAEKEVRWSDEMCRIFGIQPADFDHSFETYLGFVHPKDRHRVKRYVIQAIKEKVSFSFEHKIIRADGEERILLCRGRIILDDADKVTKIIGTGQDVTEQKEKERRLKQYSDRLRMLSEKIERTREEERVRIARQVHDELGQMLTVLKMDVSMLNGDIKKRVSEEAHEYFNRKAAKILDRINTIIKSVQRITTELRPEVLDDLGLIDAIEWQANEAARRTGIKVKVHSNVDQTDFLSEEQVTTLFRIFQETLTNVIRHAEASSVEIELERRSSELFLIVRDDGIGISDEKKEDFTSLGIVGMQERTQFLGGNMIIEGEEGEGTEVTLRIPINRY